MLNGITINGEAQLFQSGDGTFYVVGEKLSGDTLEVAADEGSLVYVDYHRVSGSRFASFYMVRIISEDGTVHTEKIYAIDTYTGRKK
jgi:hypothetical protein